MSITDKLSKTFSRSESVVYTVANMNCGHCEGKISERVAKLPGVTKVKADSSRKLLTLVYKNEQPSIDQVNEALGDTDYRAEK